MKKYMLVTLLALVSSIAFAAPKEAPKSDDLPCAKNVDIEKIMEEKGYSLLLNMTRKEDNKEGIVEWRKRVGEAEANRISKAAAGRGTRLHNIVEKYINNEDCDIQNPFDLKNFLSIQPILENIDNVHCQEQQMYSNHLRMSGTVDCIGEYKGKLSVIDFKTSSKRKEKDYIHSYFMQCAAYAIMYEEMTGLPISRLVVIISVENDYPQVFFEKRDNWVKYLLLYRNEYERITVI